MPASTGSVTEIKTMGVDNSLLTAAWVTEVTKVTNKSKPFPSTEFKMVCRVEILPPASY